MHAPPAPSAPPPLPPVPLVVPPLEPHPGDCTHTGVCSLAQLGRGSPGHVCPLCPPPGLARTVSDNECWPTSETQAQGVEDLRGGQWSGKAERVGAGSAWTELHTQARRVVDDSQWRLCSAVALAAPACGAPLVCARFVPATSSRRRWCVRARPDGDPAVQQRGADMALWRAEQPRIPVEPGLPLKLHGPP